MGIKKKIFMPNYCLMVLNLIFIYPRRELCKNCQIMVRQILFIYAIMILYSTGFKVQRKLPY